MATDLTPPRLIGTYTPPNVRPGDVARCLYRRADCKVTTWTDAPIPWPRCNQLGIRGGSGLLVNAELVRAIKTESAAALIHWFGIGSRAAWSWRRRFVPGPGKFRTTGSRAGQRKASAAGTDVTRGAPIGDETRAVRSAAAKAAGRKPPGRWKDAGWTADQLAMLGTIPDEELAAKLGRTAAAVGQARRKAGISSPAGWAPAQLALLGTMPDAELAAKLGRSVGAVRQKRTAAKIPTARDGR